MIDESLETVIDEESIHGKVREMAERISLDYAGRDLLLVSVLKGAAFFTADLARRITVPVEIEFVGMSSYGDGTVSSGSITRGMDITADIVGRDVLLVDCIVDSGRTLACLLEDYARRGPASLKAAVLLDKAACRTVPVPIGYRGFTVPDRFLVGYGLDKGGKYRNLPYIAAIGP